MKNVQSIMKFSRAEIKDLTFAGILISLAFAILLAGGFNILSGGFVFIFVIAFLTAGIGFLLHELMHKFVAQRYRLWAEFRADYKMLFVAIFFAFFGFIIAAPGAVYIHGRMTRERNGKISLAGPMTNLVLAVLFLIPLLFVQFNSEILYAFFSFGLTINSLLAAFNMIPVMPFDGAKVKKWHDGWYYFTLLSGIGLFILSFFV
jgi:Zn-dependent protease